MKIISCALLLVSLAVTVRSRAVEKTEAGKLAREVWKKCGGPEWINVEEVRFTFVEERGDREPIRVSHVWNVPRATDEVKWEGKKIEINLAAPAADDDSRAAFTRWVNDSNWLVAPLKLCDPRIELQSEGSKEVEGHMFQAIRLRFKDGGKAKLSYLLYIDEKAALVRYWESRSEDGTPRRSSWEGYRNFSGIMLPTMHRSGDTRIRLTDIQVTMAR